MSAFAPTSSIRVASVAYLNAKPLIEGLDEDQSIALSLAVPAKLLDGLRNGASDVALLPTIDYQAMPDLRVIPVGGIGCDGPTLTVRLFARVPIERVRRVACDGESHTSIALAKILFAKLWRQDVTFAPRDQASGDDDEALLLIGDKVICEPPANHPHQYDLGEAWKQLTGMPFVFAIWTTRLTGDLGELPETLADARRLGLSCVPGIVERFAVPRGWPAGIAREYLTKILKYEIGERELDAIRQFHALAAELRLIPVCQPLRTSERVGLKTPIRL